jgi:hypothetical protein
MILRIYNKVGLLQRMNTAATIAIVAIMAALAFVAASNFAIMKAFAQKNPTPSPDDNAYIHACVLIEPTPPNAAFCLPAD